MPLPASISPTQSNALEALRSVLLSWLPGTVGQDPAVFQGRITGNILTVTALPGLPAGGIQGSIAMNSPVLGAAPGTFIISQLTGTAGGVGTYQVTGSPQQVTNARTMATGVSVVAGQANRVPEPNNPWFVVMTPILTKRLSTNLVTSGDVKFTGSIAGTTLTVSAVGHGVIDAGSQLFGVNVVSPTQILRQLTGAAGGPGTYQISTTQTLSSQTLSAGRKKLQLNIQENIQLDFHAPDYTSGDFAHTVSALMRDEYGTAAFKALPAPQNQVTPLFADDPHQMPMTNAEIQYENRFVLDCNLQVNEIVVVPQEYADAVVVGLIEVDSHYPPH